MFLNFFILTRMVIGLVGVKNSINKIKSQLASKPRQMEVESLPCACVCPCARTCVHAHVSVDEGSN